MLGSLSAAVSGLDVFQDDMNVIGNNIANVNTTAFKAARMEMSNSFSNTLLAATGGSGGGNSMQIGTGVAVDSISNNWTKGTFATTNDSNDVAINGDSFFMVRDPNAATATTYATQAGAFSVDSSGYLVTADGNYRVQGYTDSTHSTIGDIQVNASTFSVGSDGTVSTNINGTQTPVGQILLQSFQNPSALVSVAGNLYSNTANAGPQATATAPGTNGLNYLQAGALELSNVDLSGEMANLITAQRGFEANSKIITASNEMLQTVVNMVH
ncbi:MAG TPA: flagellar hook-basal body complex protein [Verrucomicrobiae bacterium]|jgi:flagellar hook protein FlgE|nr:flagellar hook-basal body complex protein [Verrucomicrobiae bacterium]